MAVGTSDCFVSQGRTQWGSLVFLDLLWRFQETEYCRQNRIGALAGRSILAARHFSDDLPLKDPIQSTPTPVRRVLHAFSSSPLSGRKACLSTPTLLGGGSPGELFFDRVSTPKVKIYLAANSLSPGPLPYHGECFPRQNASWSLAGTLIKLDPNRSEKS